MSAPLSVETRIEALRRVLTITAAHGWEFSLWEGAPDDEPRIRDVDAADRLGYERPRKIRDLIEEIWPAFVGLHIREVVEQVKMPRGGTKAVTVREVWLTEAQLLKVIARSKAPVAEAILDDMIAVYMAVRRHLAATVPVVAHARRQPGAKALPAPEVTSKLTAAQTATLRAAAKKAGMSVEEFIDGMVSAWIIDLDTHLKTPSLIERRRAKFGRMRSVFVPLTEGLHEAVEEKAKDTLGNTGADSLGFAAYALLEMGAHMQKAQFFATLNYRNSAA